MKNPASPVNHTQFALLLIASSISTPRFNYHRPHQPTDSRVVQTEGLSDFLEAVAAGGEGLRHGAVALGQLDEMGQRWRSSPTLCGKIVLTF